MSSFSLFELSHGRLTLEVTLGLGIGAGGITELKFGSIIMLMQLGSLGLKVKAVKARLYLGSWHVWYTHQ